MIAHPFICRGDAWILEYHLAAYSEFADKIVVVLDRSPENEEVCRKYGAEVIHWTPRAHRPDFDETGLLCDEGEMRQVAFDACMEHRPDLMVFGDTDEAPTPDIVDFLKDGTDPDVDLYLADWVNLVQGVGTAIGGQRSRWSFQKRTNNKKGLILRVREGRHYRYDRRLQHVRLEPSPGGEGSTIVRHRDRLLSSPKLVHYKYAAWNAWQANPQSKTKAYLDLLDHAEIVPVPPSWLWPFPIHALNHEGLPSMSTSLQL